MPTFKHPCPTCSKYISRDVARCPYCGAIDPFVPGRCEACRAPIEDLAWVACPSCGAPLKEGVAPMPGAAPDTESSGTAPAPASPVPPGAAPAAAASIRCAACGTPLAPGARFCAACGTLAG